VFDEIHAELGRTLDHFGVPDREKGEFTERFRQLEGRSYGGCCGWGHELAQVALAIGTIAALILASGSHFRAGESVGLHRQRPDTHVARNDFRSQSTPS
jgi:hypothetical protein